MTPSPGAAAIDIEQARRALAVKSPRLSVERTKAAADNDQVTQQTIELMGRYVQNDLNDPLVVTAAQEVRRCFGSGNPAAANKFDPQVSDTWGVWWYVKHLLKFRLDEGALMQWHGETDQQDFLISPAVLLRMSEPKEDCDGFSMLTAALLTKLGIPAVFATVAADPNDPQRWSHVFVLAYAGGRWIPMDVSHGKHPGWMVPRNHTFRFQAWTLDGKKTEVQLGHDLHGYVNLGFGGLGQCYTPSASDDISCEETGGCSGCDSSGSGLTTDQLSTLPVNTGYNQPNPTITTATSTGGASTGSSSLSTDLSSIAALLGSAGTAAATALRAANGAPAGYTYNAAGQLVPTTAAASLTSMLPLLLVAGVAFLFISAAKK